MPRSTPSNGVAGRQTATVGRMSPSDARRPQSTGTSRSEVHCGATRPRVQRQVTGSSRSFAMTEHAASDGGGSTHPLPERRDHAEFRAFMSYSHAADGKLAPALQRGLHRLGKPWHRPPAFRVFRDNTSLTATPAL